MIPLLFVISIIAFGIIRLQPGDFFKACELSLPKSECDAMRERYGMNGPAYLQYLKWLQGIITRGDFGFSPMTNQPVLELLFGQGRLANSLLLIFATTLFSWLLAVPIGIYSATHKYSLGDHGFTFLGFIGLSIPNFFLALILLWLLVAVFQVGKIQIGHNTLCIDVGCFFAKYSDASWSWEKLAHFLWYLWPAVLVIGSANMAMLIRYIRGNLLDVLGEPYIQTARAKGLSERIVTYKHALRNAINPLISILGFWIPAMFEGTLVAAIVLNWPIVERWFWRALAQQEQYVIMTGLLFFSFALLIGNLLADILLAWADPRIRYD